MSLKTFYVYLCHGGYVFTGIGLFICLFVCLQNNSKLYQRIYMKFTGKVDNETRSRWLNFSEVDHHLLDQGLFCQFFLKVKLAFLFSFFFFLLLLWSCIILYYYHYYYYYYCYYQAYYYYCYYYYYYYCVVFFCKQTL